MNFNLAHLLSSYFIIFLGQAGLLLTGELSLGYLITASVALAVGLLRDLSEKKEILPASLANFSIVAVFAVTLTFIFILQAPPLQEIVQFLLALQAVKLLGPKKRRDWLHLYLLSFFSLIAAAALSVELSFAWIFLAYLFSAPWVLVLLHLKTATESAGANPDGESRLLSWTLFRMMAGVDAVLLALTLFFFISFPRMGSGFLRNPWLSGSGLTGFSDQLTLGDVAEIQKSSAVAMRASVDHPEALNETQLYWRGMALDLFDGRNWRASPGNFIEVKRVGGSHVVHEQTKSSAPPVRQRISLEPTGSPVLFALNRPAAIIGSFSYVFRDSLGNLRAPAPFAFSIRYEALSYPEATWREAVPIGTLLQIPELDPRLARLAREITEAADQELAKARLLERYLKENYRYSLKELPVGNEDPLTAFLFEVRQGNCEYFSSALAVMLRSLGIPARVVNGYRGGEWNHYGQYFLIRQSHAHSWVEAYIADRGWLILDATPYILGPAPGGLFNSLAQLIDFLEGRWHLHIINFSFGQQRQLLATLSHPRRWLLSGVQGSLKGLTTSLRVKPGWWTGLVSVLTILALGAIGLRQWSVRKKYQRQAAILQATERYRSLLALLKKKGLNKEPGETPDELCEKVRVKKELVREFTGLYQAARFSGQQNLAATFQKMDELLFELRK
ncbi:MAG: DUF3488 domain-containing protein [Deltaproteobacteria bacterium]|nr:DUF3488 domain-containing protein [Deltaproteobacteria bacterium]